MNPFRRLRLNIRLARLQSKMWAREEAKDIDLDDMHYLARRIHDHGLAICDMHDESQAIRSELATAEGFPREGNV